MQEHKQLQKRTCFYVGRFSFKRKTRRTYYLESNNNNNNTKIAAQIFLQNRAISHQSSQINGTRWLSLSGSKIDFFQNRVLSPKI
jgi:hypothetical protein